MFTNSSIYIKLYPVFMNGALLAAFGSTLFAPPTMIFRFATLQDKSIKGSLAEKRIEAYCRKVTWIWCGFFVLNGGIAFYTVFFASDALWSIYNGGISYILIGILFAGEFLVRKMTDKKMPKDMLPHGVIVKKVLHQTEDAASVELFIPAECEYFDDHFPEFKLLPAVAQFDLAIRLGAHFFGTPLLLKTSKRIKFSNPIFPNTRVVLVLNYKREPGSLGFKIISPSGDAKIYAGGTLILDGTEP